MKTLPNGITVFNSTPHVIRFWASGWDEPIEVEPDELVSAIADYTFVVEKDAYDLVTPCFKGDRKGRGIISYAKEQGADLIVGSIISAQAYPGDVVAMIPAPGYERVPPAEKRMRPDRFTVYNG